MSDTADRNRLELEKRIFDHACEILIHRDVEVSEALEIAWEIWKARQVTRWDPYPETRGDLVRELVPLLGQAESRLSDLRASQGPAATGTLPSEHAAILAQDLTRIRDVVNGWPVKEEHEQWPEWPCDCDLCECRNRVGVEDRSTCGPCLAGEHGDEPEDETTWNAAGILASRPKEEEPDWIDVNETEDPDAV